MVAFDTDRDGVRARDWIARGLWRDETVEWYLDRWATHRPDRAAMVDGAGRCTWAELARTVERVAHGLAAHGVERGRVVACQLPNWSEFAWSAASMSRRATCSASSRIVWAKILNGLT